MNIYNKLLDIVRDDRLLRRLSAFIIGRSGLAKLFKIKIKIQDDYNIIFHPTGFCSAFWRNPTAYREDYEFIQSFLKDGETYIDIGANVGVTVIPAAKSVGENGRVIAFEPHPTICSYLKENIALNNLKNVEIHNCALGNQQGYAYFSSKFNDEVNKIVTLPDNNNIKVPIALLDDSAEELNNIALLKIDVEGYEKFVLEGAKKTLEKVRCIYFEVSEENFKNFGYEGTDIIMAIEECGFIVFKRNDTKKEILPIDSRDFTVSSGYENLIGIKNIADFQNRTQWQVISNHNN
jgi:FkbM family methyltransferase